MRFREKNSKRVTINITSLIDVLFLLLIFFMVSSTFLERPGMKLDLPKASKREAVRMQGYTLFVTSDETLYLNDETVELNALKARLEAIAPEIEDEGIVLQADEKIRYGLVVEVMDLIKQSGIKKMVVATEIKDES
ncbi:biopolymer transporter ExbD [bacterium]|nr:biopolymer transporter ExbD [bacterium]